MSSLMPYQALERFLSLPGKDSEAVMRNHPVYFTYKKSNTLHRIIYIVALLCIALGMLRITSVISEMLVEIFPVYNERERAYILYQNQNALTPQRINTGSKKIYNHHVFHYLIDLLK